MKAAILLFAASAMAQVPTITPHVVRRAGPTGGFVLPVVGSVQGGNGTFFRTDVMLSNDRDSAQVVSLGFVPRGRSQNGQIINRTITIPGYYLVSYRDVVSSLFNTSGLGSIMVVAMNSAGQPDANALLDASARIYTNQPGSSGTVSQLIQAEEIGLTSGIGRACALGLRQDAGFRTNVGIFNMSSAARNFRIVGYGVTGTVDVIQLVNSLSMEQVPLPAGNLGDVSVCVFPDVATPNDALWSAYATSVDNTTGDSWASSLSQ